jgi:hypothetical protein
MATVMVDERCQRPVDRRNIVLQRREAPLQVVSEVQIADGEEMRIDRASPAWTKSNPARHLPRHPFAVFARLNARAGSPPDAPHLAR